MIAGSYAPGNSGSVESSLGFGNTFKGAIWGSISTIASSDRRIALPTAVRSAADRLPTAASATSLSAVGGASRANFGLVWVQGKGLGRPEYAAWCRLASELWPDFAAELRTLTGIDVRYARTGGVNVALSDVELRRSADVLAGIRREAGANRFAYEVLDRHELAKLLPGLGERVVGGTFCPMDGAANPLALLRGSSTLSRSAAACLTGRRWAAPRSYCNPGGH